MFFDTISEASPDAVFGKLKDFQKDPRPEKLNLMVGIYKDEHLSSRMLPSVLAAKEKASRLDQIADYLPFDGLPEFVDLIGAVVFGNKIWQERKKNIYGTVSVGGTGGLHLGAELIAQEVGKKIAIPNPTWANHRGVFERSGLHVHEIPYYNSKMHQFDCKKYIDALLQLDRNTAVLLHGACHNPTGCDPTTDDWKEIAKVMKEKGLIPFFDFAYQGFGDGIEEDAIAVRTFVECEMEFLIAYSCSKNFSLYCHRVGALFAVCLSEKDKTHVGSQIRRIIRTNYSNPPIHGEKIVIELLKDQKLSHEWRQEVDQMRRRLKGARDSFLDLLLKEIKDVDFSFARKHKGMFSYLDLTDAQVKRLIERHGVYMLANGRLNVAGLIFSNIQRVVEAISEVCRP